MEYKDDDRVYLEMERKPRQHLNVFEAVVVGLCLTVIIFAIVWVAIF